MVMVAITKRCLSVFLISVYVFSNLLSPASAFEAIRLSDEELDEICVGGFEFNLNAAYAFRSAVLSQTNISAVDNLGANTITINAINKGIVVNEGDSAVASQANISVVFSKVGDIIDTMIRNVNLAKVSNVFTDPGGAVVQTMVMASSNASSSLGEPAGAAVVPTAQIAATNPPPSSLGEETPAAQTEPVPMPSYTMKINEIKSKASATVAQTNIAAVVASQGDIKNVEVENINLADVKNVGNAAVAAQTNITLVMAGGEIEDSHVKNFNKANVDNVVTTQEGGAVVTPLSLEADFGKIFVNQVAAQNAAEIVQTNITFVKSKMNNLKNKMNKHIKSNIKNAFKHNKFMSF